MKTVTFSEKIEVRYFHSSFSLDESRIIETDLPPVQIINSDRDKDIDCHFYIHLLNRLSIPPELLGMQVYSSIPDREHVKNLYVIIPNLPGCNQYVGIELDDGELLVRYVLDPNWLESFGNLDITPGNLARNWPNATARLLQGFFYLMNDPVEKNNGNLCYMVSLPPNTTNDEIISEFARHKISSPIDIVYNPYEENHIRRLEFSCEATRYSLYSLGIRFRHLKPVIILPCNSRIPVELLYEQLQVKVSNLASGLSPKFLISRLEGRFGPIAELIYPSKPTSAIIVFQLKRSADRALERGEIMLKNRTLRFERVSKPYRMTGRLITTADYIDKLPRRPLPLVPNSSI
jgi:hypothetical protein